MLELPPVSGDMRSSTQQTLISQLV